MGKLIGLTGLYFIFNLFFLNGTLFLFICLWLCWVFRCCVRAFSSCGEWGLLFVAVRRLLIAVVSLVAQ